MRKNIKILVSYLILILIIPYSAAYSGSEAGYEVKLLTPNEYLDTSSENPYLLNLFVNPGVSGLSRTEGNFQVGLNIYPGSMGGGYNEQGYKLYLVPEEAFISYSYGITANDPDAEGSNEEIIKFTLPLKIGWNMVSLPIIPDNSSVNAIFGGNVTTVYGWTGTSYVLRNELEPKKGYWALSNGNYNITVTGTPVVDRNITLTNGWNMVGPVTDEIMVFSLPNVTTVYGWTGTSYTIVSSSNTLALTKGYWMLANEPSIIQV